jgi:hypothetical protein
MTGMSASHATPPTATDLLALIAGLDAPTLEREIDRLDAARKATIVLLRAVRARARLLARREEVARATS